MTDTSIDPDRDLAAPIARYKRRSECSDLVAEDELLSSTTSKRSFCSADEQNVINSSEIVIGSHPHPYTRIVDILPEVLQKILAFDEYSQNKLTSMLRGTGNKLIRRQLGFVCVHHTLCACLQAKCKSPTCFCVRVNASDMPNLRSLVIGIQQFGQGMSDTIVPSLKFLKKDLERLPASLNQLQIGTNIDDSSVNIWNLQSNLLQWLSCAKNLQFLRIVCTIRKPDMLKSPFSVFTNLHTLVISSRNTCLHNDWIGQLPPTLTAFKCSKASISTVAIAAALPRGLTALSIDRWNADVPMLPYLNSLSRLDLYVLEPSHFNKLPPQLTTLKMQELREQAHNFVIPETVTDLRTEAWSSRDRCQYPPHLQFIRHMVVFYELKEEFRNPFASCSQTLVSLNLHINCAFDDDYFQLSSLISLETLELYARSCPSSLEGDAYMIRFFKLPPNLRDLKCEIKHISGIGNIIPFPVKILPFDDDASTFTQLRQVSISLESWHFAPSVLHIEMNPSQYPKLNYAGFVFWAEGRYGFLQVGPGGGGGGPAPRTPIVIVNGVKNEHNIRKPKYYGHHSFRFNTKEEVIFINDRFAFDRNYTKGKYSTSPWKMKRLI